MEFFTKLSFAVQITGAFFGVLIVLVGYHLSTLQDAKTKPRTITPEQKTNFIKALDGAPRGQVLVSFKLNDDEARDFALQIKALLQSAGYEPQPNEENNLAWFQNAEPRIGIGIRIVSIETQPLYAGALQRAFQAMGIEPILQSGAFTQDVPEVRVGSR